METDPVSQTLTKFENPVILSVIHYRQDPLEYNYFRQNGLRSKNNIC
jgi:hypothetical protein